MHFVITGASSGLGAALAVELGRRGHALGLIARRASELEGVADRVRAAGGTAAFEVADVLDAEATRAAVRRLEAPHGPVDVMVANAGSGAPNRASRIDPEKVTSVMRLNFDGVVHAFAAVLPDMVARRSGHLAAVSSFAAWRGLPPGGPYSASKAAVTTLLEAYRIELAREGIAVTTIHPGFVRTPLTDKNRHPMPFLMEPERAARIMADGLERRRREINFPWQLHLLMRGVRLLPGALFEPLFRRLALPPAER